MRNLYTTTVPRKFPGHTSREFVFQSVVELGNLFRTPYLEEVVHVNRNDQYHGFIFHEAEHAWIGLALLKTVTYDRVYEKLVEHAPAPCLLQPLQTTI